MAELTIRITPFTDWADGKQWTTSWHGKVKRIGNVKVDLPCAEDVEEVLYEGESGDVWDGKCAALVRLKDGRLMAYETFYGPTGNGFYEDAYGGDAEVWFAHPRSLKTLVLQAFTDEGRRLLGIPEEGL